MSSQPAVGTPRFPDFIIAGAMKSGTSSLHAMLSEHPRVFIPPGEVGFFDHDDFCEHVDYFVTNDGGFCDRDFDERLAERLDWYRSLFAAARPDQLAGVDSTTYLSSRAAPSRIARHIPHARIIILLREPASRAYSQYWHMLSAGRMLYSFEDTLRLMPERILTRSCYVAAVRRYLECFPRRQLHFVAFENFARDPSAGTTETLEFLGLGGSDFHRVPAPGTSTPLGWRDRRCCRCIATAGDGATACPVTCSILAAPSRRSRSRHAATTRCAMSHERCPRR